MPGFDRTGPGGEGPRTGRGAGRCEGAAGPGRALWGIGRRGGGRGCRRGLGRGRGRGLGPFGRLTGAPYQSEDKTYLEDLERALESDLEDVRNRLKDMPE